jgi:predicted DNA-binding transcriptional regulator AlpA
MQHDADSPLRINPRLIRLRDAPFYLGMDKNRFCAEVRPHVVEIRIGKQGVAFDRFDLDAWVDQYIAVCTRTEYR